MCSDLKSRDGILTSLKLKNNSEDAHSIVLLVIEGLYKNNREFWPKPSLVPTYELMNRQERRQFISYVLLCGMRGVSVEE